MKNPSKKKILYLIQLPPPVHGVSIINKLVYNSVIINKNFEKKLIKINFSLKIDELRRFSFKKMVIFLFIEFKLFLTLSFFRPDLVYFSLIPVGKGFLRDSLFVFTIKLFKPSIILHLNNRGIPRYVKKPLYNFLYKKVFDGTTIIHVSEGLMKSEIKPLHLKNIKTFVVGNTIPEFSIEKKKESSKRFRILFLSNFIPEKGLSILLQAINLLKNKHPNIQVDAYGASYNKTEDEKIKKYIEDNDLEKMVYIHGPVYGEEKIKAFSNADIFVFPSFFEEECFPLVILEAMNAGLPTIATNIGAISEMIEDCQEGLLVAPKKPGQLANKINVLAKNPIKRKQMGSNSYLKFKTKFAYPVFKKKLRGVFEAELSDE